MLPDGINARNDARNRGKEGVNEGVIGMNLRLSTNHKSLSGKALAA